MIVSEFMTKNPICIDSNDSLKSLNEIVNVEGHTHVPVTNEGELVGIISKSDLMSRFLVMLEELGTTPSTEELENLPVKSFMTKNPSSTLEDAHIDSALEILLNNNFQCIVAVDRDNHVTGLVTSYDLLEALNEESRELKFAS